MSSKGSRREQWKKNLKDNPNYNDEYPNFMFKLPKIFPVQPTSWHKQPTGFDPAEEQHWKALHQVTRGS